MPDVPASRGYSGGFSAAHSLNMSPPTPTTTPPPLPEDCSLGVQCVGGALAEAQNTWAATNDLSCTVLISVPPPCLPLCRV